MSRRQRACRARLNPHRMWAILDRLNMSQNELARLLGTSSSYLSQLMSGYRRPPAARAMSAYSPSGSMT